MKLLMRDERGMALAVAIFTLVVIGAFVAGALFVGTQEQRVGSNSSRSEQSFRMAELGVAEVIGNWPANRMTYNRLRAFPLDTAKIAWTNTANKTGSYSGNIFRLSNTTFLVDITARDSMTRAGRVREGGAQQRLGVVVRIQPLQVNVQAALTAGGVPTFAGGDPLINGGDSIPTGWSGCPPIGASLAGVRLDAAGDVAGVNDHITGTPKAVIDPSIDSTTFTQFGATSWAQLAAQANITMNGAGTYAPAPVVAGGVCNTAVASNWGDNVSTNPCGSYFPIIRLNGNATFSGGQGQGILMVDGNLYASGSFTFYGLVIVKGTLTAVPGQSLKVWGAVFAKNVNLPSHGGPLINYSNCALGRALTGTGVAALNRSRSWVQLF